MSNRILAVGVVVLAVATSACMRAGGDEPKPSGSRNAVNKTETPKKVVKSDAEWRRQLTEQQYYVTRRKGTEPAFSGRYWNHHGDGIYRCIGCATPLFDSRTKFESGTGWPSFFAPLNRSVVRTEIDRSNFSIRTEVLCRVCDAHLGHVFKDGPRPTGLRFCMNSATLNFQNRAEAEAEAAARAVLEAESAAEETPEPEPEGTEPGSERPAPDQP